MLIRFINAYLWVYAKALGAVLWFMHKVLKKDQFTYFLLGLAQLYTNVGRSLTLRALGFAIENNVEIKGEESTEEPSSGHLTEDEGPLLNVPPGMPAALPPPSPTEMPVFRSEDGQIIPFCFDPLPEYSVFEALYASKYGKFNRCSVVVMGKMHVFTCSELYAFLQKIAQDDKAPVQLRALYGSMVSMIVNRHGHVFDAKAVS